MQISFFPLLMYCAIGVGPLRLVDDRTTMDDAPADTASERDEGWRSDLEFLVEEARRLHADPDRPAFSSHFDEETAALFDSIPEFSDDQVLAGLMKLVALLKRWPLHGLWTGAELAAVVRASTHAALVLLVSDGPIHRRWSRYLGGLRGKSRGALRRCTRGGGRTAHVQVSRSGQRDDLDLDGTASLCPLLRDATRGRCAGVRRFDRPHTRRPGWQRAAGHRRVR